MCRCFRTLVCAALLLVTSLPLAAAELQQDFVNGLRKQGLGDMGSYYLKQLEANKKIPASMTETFDLELARCMQVAALFTENIGEAKALRDQTRTQLDKFLKEHPTHAEAGAAFDTYGVLSLTIGHSYLQQGNAQKDAKVKEEFMAQAKTAYEESRPRFTEAVKLFQVHFEALTKAAEESEDEPRTAKNQAARRRQEESLFNAEYDWLNARYNLAKVDYFVAQTYTDPKHKDVKPLLESAEKALYSIRQGYNNALPGLLAFYWSGRINEQLGNLEKARDIYDEVTGSEPESDVNLPQDVLNFYGENFLRWMSVSGQLKKHDEQFFANTEDWLKDNIGRKSDSYYGVVVELAKATAAVADKQPAAEKAKIMAKVVGDLRGIEKITSPYQNEAIRLKKLYGKSIGEEPEEAKTFDEAFANADAAMKNGQPGEAVIQLERALALKDQEKDPERLQFVQYQLALAKYLSEDVAGSVLLADKFAREFPKTKFGPTAAVLAINGSLFLCSTATAEGRPAAEKQLNSIVQFTIQTWPNNAEADDARIALGSLKMANRDPEGAIVAYKDVNPASERAAKSQSLSAKAHRLIYAMARQANKLDDAAKAHLTQSRTEFEQALAAASKSSKPEDDLVVAECRLNLAEMHLEAGEVDPALALLTPLEAKIRESNPETLDNAQLRTLLSAIRVHSVKKNLAGALACGLLLLEKGPADSLQVNSALISVTRLMRDDYKADQGKLLEISQMESPDQATVLAANIKADASKAALLSILNKLAPRDQLNLPEIVAMGDFAADAGLPDLALSMYQRALKVGESLTTKTPQTVAALTRVQVALIGLLRAGGQFAEALVQVDALIAANPKALDPRIERARILQGMAETDPAKWKEAVTAWSELKNLYQRAPKKPAAYYDMVYSIGQCLAGEARTANDQKTAAEKKKQANQLLKGTLALSPELNGPEMVAKFNELLEELSQQ
jgi:hypothetical protein